MTQGSREQLFRREALEHRATAAVSGGVLRVAPRWTSVAFYVLVGFFVVAVVTASIVRIPRYVQGTIAAGRDGGSVLLVPAALTSRIEDGGTLGIDGTTVTVLDVGSVIEPAQVRRSHDADVTGPSVAVAVSGAALRPGASVKVLIDREAVLVSLIPGLGSLLGGSDG